MEYWDSSALLKLFIQEPDSEWFENYAGSQPGPIYTSTITTVEVTSTVIRKIRQQDLKLMSFAKTIADFRSACEAGRIVPIPCAQDVIDQAREVAEQSVRDKRIVMNRSLDAIQVASALVVGAKTMVATDGRLREVAARNGLKLVPAD